ncbi:vitamin B12 ABC transporter substrate-binding protein BtuF [Klebsiella pneumoniae subsp. pneumoniae]|nr:vitamin B12 ABC transporter substrate-binding protein BtuF [Klebsiella pneumoniae subsp. pneumoniae]
MAKSLSFALAALLLLAPAWLLAAPRVITLSPPIPNWPLPPGSRRSASAAIPIILRRPKRSNRLPAGGMNLERIVALKPDVVLAWRGGNAERQVNQLQSLGIHVLWVQTSTIEEIIATLRELAQWSPQPEKAQQAAQAMQQEYDALKARYANAPKKRVFLQFGSAPLFTSGPGSIQDQVLRLCGGENIFATSRVPWPQVSREQVLARQPQAIVVTGDASRIAEAQRFGNISSPFR